MIFFNDTTGAWLKASQIRPFDRYNGDLCQEHDSSVAKFRRYHERIRKAVSIAEKHLCRASKPVRVKVLPPSKSKPPDGPPTSSPPSQVHYENTQSGRVAAPKRNGTLKPPLFNTATKKSGTNGAPLPRRESHAAEHQSEPEKVGTNEVRPKRKRMRSIRYIDHDSVTLGLGSSHRKQVTHPSSSPQAGSIEGSAGSVSKVENDGRGEDLRGDAVESKLQGQRRSLRLRQSTVLPKSGVLNGKRSRRKRVRSFPNDTYREREEEIGKLSNLDSCASYDSIPDEPTCQGDRSPSLSNDLNNTRLTSDTAEIERKGPELYLRKRMFVTELKEAMTESNENDKCRADGTRRLNRIRSLVGVGSRPERHCTEMDDWTDSEQKPERERKVILGSLQAAAEDLVEYAVQGSRSDSSDVRSHPAGSHCIAFSNNDLVSSIMNRLSNMERDIKLLKKRSTFEDRATLGEDATAAGVKSAVEALASASLAFAKARNYDVAIIRRSMEMLWPDQDLPLTGADGDLLRTVAQSLILASCKRRDAEMANAGRETQDCNAIGRESAERSGSRWCHRQEYSSSVLENGDGHKNMPAS